jgi:hypothetical protein
MRVICPWPKSRHTGFEGMNSQIAQYIVTQQNAGTKRDQIVENLLKDGHEMKDIRSTVMKLRKISFKKNKAAGKCLDWRSPTAINSSARMIRNDVRMNKVSYPMAMRTLIKARNTLQTMIRNPRRDKRLSQINHEIQTTKRLLAPKFADKKQKANYRIIF